MADPDRQSEPGLAVDGEVAGLGGCGASRLADTVQPGRTERRPLAGGGIVCQEQRASRGGQPRMGGVFNLNADPEKHMARLERLKAKHGNGNGAGLPLQIQAHLAGWPTPDTNKRGGGAQDPMKRKSGGHSVTLQDAVLLAGWPTPMAASLPTETRNGGGNTDSSRKTTELAGWPTPMSTERTSSPETMAKRLAFRQKNGQTSVPLYLNEVAATAGWATPTTRDHKDTGGAIRNVPINSLLGRQVQLASDSGPTTTSSTAPTEKRGALNPAHSRWLMGYPPAWDDCGATVTRSTRTSRRNSSGPASKLDATSML